MSKNRLLLSVALVLMVSLAACSVSFPSTSPISTPDSPLPSSTPLPSPTWTPTAELRPTFTETPVPTPTETPMPTPVPLYTGGVWVCWDRGQSVPCAYDASLSLKQMAFVSDTEAWAVGGNGYIARWDGYTWTRVASPMDRDLNDVVFLSPDNGWAVGEGGIILHWDGRTWSVVRDYQPPLPGSGTFLEWNAVEFSSPNDGWVVGCIDSEGGSTLQAMHWNGKDWQDSTMPIPWTSYRLHAVKILSSQDVWAVGGGFQGITLHWDGFRWQEISNPFSSRTSPPAWFYAINASLPDNVWIAGLRASDDGGTEGVVLHWDGEKWLDGHLPPTGWVLAVLIISESDGWVGGDDLFHWNGQEWEKAANPVFDRIVDIASSPNGEIWALTWHGAFLHLQNKEGVK